MKELLAITALFASGTAIGFMIRGVIDKWLAERSEAVHGRFCDTCEYDAYWDIECDNCHNGSEWKEKHEG